MKDPVRLLEDDEASAAVRDLLRAARAPEPTEDQRAALWGSIAGAIGPGPGGGTDGGGPGGGGPDGGGPDPGGTIDAGAGDPGAGLDLAGSVGSAASGSVPATVSSASSGAVGVVSTTATPILGAKVVGAQLVGAKIVGSAATTWLGLVAAAGLSVGTAVMVGGPERSAPAASPAATVDIASDGGRLETLGRARAAARSTGALSGPSAEEGAGPGEVAVASDGAAPPAAAVPLAAGAPAPAAADAPPRSAAGEPPVGSSDEGAPGPAPAPSTARDEVAVTTRARELIHAGEAGRALAELEAARVRFSGGVLVQERAALTVEALGRSGQHERAAALARAFLDSWPNSAHAGLVRPWAK